MKPEINYSSVHGATILRIVRDGDSEGEYGWLNVVAVGENGEEQRVAVIHGERGLAPAIEVVEVKP